jgi:hypothetical protein
MRAMAEHRSRRSEDDGLGIDHSGRDTEDRATRLEVRVAMRTVAAVSPPLWILYLQSIGEIRPALR